MSDLPYEIPPLISPKRARDIGVSYKAMADFLRDNGLYREAARSEHHSNWWLTYAIALATTQSQGPSQ